MRARCSLVLLAALAGCMDNPFGRPATVVDGEMFPDDLKGVIAPEQGFVAGQAVSFYELGLVSGEIGEVVELRDASGGDLPICDTRAVDEDGTAQDVDIAGCQGRVFSQLPGRSDYTPFVRIRTVDVGNGYELNSVRSVEEAMGIAGSLQETERVMDLTVVDVRAAVVDPTGEFARLTGWFDTLQLAYLELATDLPVDGDRVQSMPMYLPDLDDVVAGDPGALFEYRAGDAGYSTLCRIVLFAVPEDYEAGDITDVAQINPADIIEPSPQRLIHCVVP